MVQESDQEPKRDKCPTRIGKYQVGGVIGKGGFGHVYKALDQGSGEMVAIKQMGTNVLSSGDLGSIELEITLLSKLKHRNIVKYIDSIRTDLHLNIVLEYVEGGSLSSLVKKFHAIPESLCAIYTWQILNGLAYLHAQGVIHRDIKGANVLVTKRGTVKLADFGVATKLSEVDNSKRSLVGTSYWMAPEIVEMSPATPACDMWSVGGTVVEMITENPPYFHLPQMSAMFRIVQDPHPPLPDCISPALENFLLACWEKNPNLRAGASELLEHEWIQANKRQSIEFTRSQKMAPLRSQDEEDEDDDEDQDADAQVVETMMATMGKGQDPLGLVNGSRVGSGTPSAGKKDNALSPAASRSPTKTLAESIPTLPPDALGPKDVSVSPQAQGSDMVNGTSMVASVQAPSSVGLPSTLNNRGTEGLDADAFGMDGRSGSRELSRHSSHGHSHNQGRQGSNSSTNNGTRPSPPEISSGKGREGTNGEMGEVSTTEQDYPFFFVQEAQRMDQKKLSDLSTNVENGEASMTLVPSQQEMLQQQQPRAPGLSGSAWQALAPNTPAGSNQEPLHLGPFFGSLSAPALAAAPVHVPAAGQRDAAEIKQLLDRIRPFEAPEELIPVCQRLTQLLQQEGNEESNLNLLMQHGAVPIAEMLQVTDPALLREVLQMVNLLAENSELAQEIFATVGLIPGVIKFARSKDLPHLRREAATFISRLCKTSERSLQLLVACGGLEALADLVAHDYYNNRDLVWLALDALDRIFRSAAQNGRNNDFCRILAKHGLCGHLCMLVDTLAGDILVEKASGYLTVVVNLLLHFAKEGDAIVKVYMAKGPVQEGLLSALEFLPPELSVQIFKTFKWLAQEPSVLNMLENHGVVPSLVTFLAELSQSNPLSVEATSISQDACSQCLLALFYLCKLSRPRQEQAALAGATTVLRALVTGDHPLKAYAFVMLCDMTSASLATRRLLWNHGGVELLVDSLQEPQLQASGLEALVGWTGVREHRADWCVRLEGVLLRDDCSFVPQLLSLFAADSLEVFMQVLEQLLKLTRRSSRLSGTLAASDDFFEVVRERLQPTGLPRPAAATTIVVAVAEKNDGGGIEASPTPTAASGSVPRWSSAQGGAVRPQMSGAEAHGIQDDEIVRARKNLLRLLLQICEGLELPHLGSLCKRYDLASLLKGVLLEEQRRQRMILCEFAKQLLELLREALSADANAATV